MVGLQIPANHASVANDVRRGNGHTVNQRTQRLSPFIRGIAFSEKDVSPGRPSPLGSEGIRGSGPWNVAPQLRKGGRRRENGSSSPELGGGSGPRNKNSSPEVSRHWSARRVDTRATAQGDTGHSTQQEGNSETATPQGSSPAVASTQATGVRARADQPETYNEEPTGVPGGRGSVGPRDTARVTRYPLPSPSYGSSILGKEPFLPSSTRSASPVWGWTRGSRERAQASSPPAGLAAKDPLQLFTMCRQFRHTGATRAGTLVVQPMAARQVEEVVDLLTDSFEDYFGVFSYRPFLRSQVSVYIAQRLMLFPRGVTLVGRIINDEDGEYSEGEGLSSSSSPSPSSSPLSSPTFRPSPSSSSPSAPPSSLSRIVGVTEVSFGRPAIPTFLTLNPPDGSAYLGNMAVLHENRRQGVARVLLSAAEELVRLTEFPAMHLHCRLVDEAPFGLYESAGFETVSVDHRLAPFLTWEGRRRLMRKGYPMS